MKILVLAALIAVAISSEGSPQQGPWRPGRIYKYAVNSYTLVRLPESNSSGSAFQAQFVVRAIGPNRLFARLERPQHAVVHQELPGNRGLPSDLKYEPAAKLDQPFYITIEDGRVVSLSLPTNIPLTHENLLKGLIGALQLDLTTYKHIRRDDNGYDDQTKQGMFKKMETDVTGDCETMYNVHPAIPEWRRELPAFANEEEPIMISKTKNYGHCHHSVAYHFGVPQGSEWAGTASRPNEEQLIRRATVSRILAGKQGPIYKTETTSTVHVNPQVYGKDKAEVLSFVQLILESYGQDTEPEWQKPENYRELQSLLYSISPKQVNTRSSEESNEASYEILDAQKQPQLSAELKNRIRRASRPSSPKSLKVEQRPQLNQQQYERAPQPEGSSESNSASTYVNDDLPKISEPAYAAMYMTPEPHADKKQAPVQAQKLAQELAQQLQNPSNMPKGDFLSKFNVLVRVIACMSSEQLTITSRGIEVAKSSNNQVKADIWMVFRDAVVQAGTLPAFQQIRTWIMTKKIQGEEAAQVVVSLVYTIRYPTKEIMIQFYRMAMSDEVRQQKYLNSTALIAATKFINMGQVNNETAYSFYPSHMYGRMSRQLDAFVLEEILPPLSVNLKEAIQKGDSDKAQVYIKAIGNLGHREVLEVFAPYLEGKIPTTTFLRMQMVKNLQVLAHQRDSFAKAVLFSILKNIAEPYEVRVAAIENIFMARPNTAMMQAMAQMTHIDPSVQVRAVLKSSIESAAELKNPQYFELARTAQAAKWMLTKQEYGKQYSNKYLKDFNDDESEQSFLSAFAQIGSEDSLFPKSLKYSIKSKTNGWDKEQTISTCFSSVQRLVSAVQQLSEMSAKPQRSETQHKYSAEKVSELLNIKREPKSPFEAALLVALMGQERYITFSESDLQQLPAVISQLFTALNQGVETHYTKVLNQEQVSIMFPVCSGMPFIFKYKTPTVVHFQGKAKGQVNPRSKEPSIFNTEMQFTYARNIDGSVGFMDTLANKYASVGVVSKLQLYVPLKMKTEIKANEYLIQMEPLRPNQDDTIVHYSVWPYSANQNKDALGTVALDSNTKAVERDTKVISMDMRLGKELGNQFQLQGYSYSLDYKNIGSLMSQDLFVSIANALYQKDVAMTHFNLRYLGKQSPNNHITIRALYEKLYKQKQPAQPLSASKIEDTTPQSQARREEMIMRVGAGIETARVQILDMSVSFQGAQTHELVLTAAMADSKVDNKMQYALFAGRNSAQLGNSQVNAAVSIKKPALTSLNFLEALQKKMMTTFEAKIGYGENSNIHLTGQTERSKKYEEQLKNHPRGKQCAQEIASNNFYQQACREMIVKAHAPDSIKVLINYSELKPELKFWAQRVLKTVEYFGYPYSDFKEATTVLPNGRLEVESKLWYQEESMDLVLRTPYGGLRFIGVPIPEVTPYALAIYSPISAEERVFNFFTRAQYQPLCTVDGSKIWTFSNRQYDYTLTRSWHVVMQDDGSRQGRNEQLVVLARSTNEKQKEVYISYKTNTGKDLELEIQPALQPNGKHIVKVKTNAADKGDQLYMDWNKPLLQYYTQLDGVLVVNIGEDRLRVIYDGNRLVVLARENRQNIRGICGYMDGESRHDYLTPNGIVDKPEHYGASFALNDADSDPKTQQLQSEAKKLAYPLKEQYTTILPANQEWRKARQEKMYSERREELESQVMKSRSYQASEECQILQQIQYYEDHSQICVTTELLPACNSRCKGEGYKVQEAKVMCRPKIDVQFRAYRDQIRQGENPEVSGAALKTKKYRVPSSCRA